MVIELSTASISAARSRAKAPRVVAPLNSQTQVSQALLAQRRVKVFVRDHG